MKRIFLSCCLIVVLSSCTSTKKTIQKGLSSTLSTPFYENQFTGVLFMDATTKDTLFNQNSTKYFTPASNTKIFTLYTALNTLPDRIPALRYIRQNDTLFVQGTGDPSFLHPYLKDSTAFKFLQKEKNIALSTGNFQDSRFGPGWSWEDYDYYYSPERSGFPTYGNVVLLTNGTETPVVPEYFKDSVIPIANKTNRKEHRNLFYFDAARTDTLEVPFKTSDTTLKAVLEKELKTTITIVKEMPLGSKQTLYGIPADSLYVRLMHESDNFIAEQLLLLSASETADTLQTQIAITNTLDKLLPNLPQGPRWVDGSGLSRYNLFTPQSMVHVLERLYVELPRERLFKIFPSGGVSGTLTDWYEGNSTPYIYAKSGSLGNNYCLSGYLLTNSGKTVIFSFMNNHFKHPSSEIKTSMQQLFEKIRDTY
ncbi:D-alanyl-D-alanine carboxypeptidase/D-alanyl-D-alanine-endopeptidase [Maribacter chungangensis]|uniref:D-alanyl-D-alanine carboxypeptidase/D-alanyl-D-alanine-endopeptidase n=1 Tax=Maribacter chungangensis TaxID=1069117 RepID=A0ABW3BAR4_9FLAO